jgi:hypothetical protein
VMILSEVNLGDLQPQLLFRPALSPVPATTLCSPQSQRQTHIALPSLAFGALLTTFKELKICPVKSFNIVYQPFNSYIESL